METLLAHQGGWDEILLVAGPILVIIGLLRLAKKLGFSGFPAFQDELRSELSFKRTQLLHSTLRIEQVFDVLAIVVVGAKALHVALPLFELGEVVPPAGFHDSVQPLEDTGQRLTA